MTDYTISEKADSDLTEIYEYSFKQFGELKADAYLASLEEKFLFLAENPKTGINIDYIRQGYYKCKHISHTIFYIIKNRKTIMIVRVLHSNMDNKTHLN